MPGKLTPCESYEAGGTVKVISLDVPPPCEQQEGGLVQQGVDCRGWGVHQGFRQEGGLLRSGELLPRKPHCWAPTEQVLAVTTAG